MSADDYMSSRLGEMLQDLKVRQIEPEEPGLTLAEQLIATDESLWKEYQEARERKWEEETERQEKHEVLETLNEAAELVGLSTAELRERIARANARGASAPFDIEAQMGGEYDPGAEYRERQAQEAEQWEQILQGSRDRIAREDAYQARMNGDEVPGNHSEEVPAADA